MLHFGRAVVKLRVPIIIIGLLLLIPSVMGYLATGVNYDMLTYLPEDMETVEGQNILKNDFGKGAFSLIITEGMSDSQVADLTDQIKEVPHVADALSYGSIADASIPDQAVPKELLDKVKNGDDEMIAVFFDDSTSAGSTIDAVTQIRSIADDNVYVGGMSALVTDLKNLAEEEEPKYVAVAVICALLVLLLCTDSFLAPFVFLASIAIAIIYNLGSNIFLGEISYITKALAAVLQLAVTMDYSIFLWNSFEENLRKYPDDGPEAMTHAIAETLTAIFSSALTATAGFLAMIFMSYTLGADLGVVMAKGCLLGLLCSVTILPALILFFEKPMLRLHHKRLIPDVPRLARAITSKKGVAIAMVIFIIMLVPASIGYNNRPVYYDFTNMVTGSDTTIPEEKIRFHTADMKLKEEFNVSTTMMILADADLNHYQAKKMLDEINDVEGVQYALGYDSVKGGMIPDSIVPSDLKDSLKANGRQLIIINSEYQPSTDAVNAQIDEIDEIVKQYDASAMLIGEAPATKDLIATTDHDFLVVDAIAIVAILVILLVVFRSLSLPFILTMAIEFAIMINLGIPYFQEMMGIDAAMAFIAPICISTIQLGSTVNYAILLTTRYKRERKAFVGKRESIQTAFRFAFPAVITSAVSFFAATFGVAMYSNMGIISSLCLLMARGAVISMFSVLFILPAMLMVFDKLIIYSTLGFKELRAFEAGKKESGEPAAQIAATAQAAGSEERLPDAESTDTGIK